MKKVPSGSNILEGTFFHACIPQLFGEYFHRVSSHSTPFIFGTKRINT